MSSPSNTLYSEHRDYVLGVIAGRCRWVAPGDRQALYHDAYASMLALERAGRLAPDSMHPLQLRAYLARAAVRKALDERKSAERRLTGPLDQAAENHPDPSRSVEEQAAARFDSGAVREILSELPDRQRAVVQLRFVFELEPMEVQGVLGISARAYRKELERAVRQIASRYELVREGRWCETRRSMVLAYVAGIAGPRRALQAEAHLATCPGCARMAGELRQATQQAAAAMPLPEFALDNALPERFGVALAHARETMTDLGSGLKQQSAGIAGRLSDPTPLAGARPGAAAAAIAGCLAIGGGGAYCAVEGLPDVLRSSLGIERAADETAPPDDDSSREAPAEPVDAPAPPPAEDETAPPPADPVAEPDPEPAQPPAEPAPQPPEEKAAQEFGIEQPAAPSAATSNRDFSSPAPSQNSTAGPPAGGSQEFGFEN